eukprot:6185677-Pleurochrysis_carterae.AAC.1
MADATCPSSASSPPAVPAYPLALAAHTRAESRDNSFRKRKQPYMLPLLQVQNVGPTRLERRTKTGAQITSRANINIVFEPNGESYKLNVGARQHHRQLLPRVRDAAVVLLESASAQLRKRSDRVRQQQGRSADQDKRLPAHQRDCDRPAAAYYRGVSAQPRLAGC